MYATYINEEERWCVLLVGKIDISIAELVKHDNSIEEFIAYADSLVPKEFAHIPQILQNQRYINCLAYRKKTMINWDKKKEICNGVLRTINVSGFTDRLIEVNDLMNAVDSQVLESFYRKEN